MKRILVLLASALMLVGIAVAGPAPSVDAMPDLPEAVQHSVSIEQQINICQYLDPGVHWNRVNQRHLHYGSADVVQCEYRGTSSLNYGCRDYVWNYPWPPYAWYTGLYGDTPQHCL